MANEARFQVWPDVDEDGHDRWYWHFQDRNGRLTFTGGQGFADKDNALEAIDGAIHDVVGLLEIDASSELEPVKVMDPLPIEVLEERPGA